MAELPYGAATASGWERTGAGCGTMPEKIYYGTNSQMKAKKMAEWISVKDRLPKDYISVIGHMTNAGVFPSVRECYYIGKGFYFPALKDFEPVDYWQEMPEPPKGE